MVSELGLELLAPEVRRGELELGEEGEDGRRGPHRGRVRCPNGEG